MAFHEAEQAGAAPQAGADPGRMPEPAAAGCVSIPLRAPVAGQVLRVIQTSQATVALGAPLLELGDLRQLEVVAELLTTDALQCRPGSPVRIRQRQCKFTKKVHAMSCHTIVVHVDQSPHAAGRIRVACDIAHRTGAHLIGAAMTGVSRFMFANDTGSFDRTVLRLQAERLEHQATAALAQFDALVLGAALPSSEKRLIADDAQGALIGLARFSDLVVLSQGDPDLAAPAMAADLPAWVVMNAVRPVLVVPHAATLSPINGHVLIAWNGSNEAARAARDALPLLADAARITVAHIGATMRRALPHRQTI